MFSTSHLLSQGGHTLATMTGKASNTVPAQIHAVLIQPYLSSLNNKGKYVRWCAALAI